MFRMNYFFDGDVFLPTIKKNYLVTKKNELNEMRATGMTLQELRFLAIYLSKIDPNNLNSRQVRFSINDFQSIMELGRIKPKYMTNVADNLLSHIIHQQTENGGFEAFQLFKKCTVDMDAATCEWYVEIDAHDDALALMFDYKSKYFAYRLSNALRIKSPNQLRMYEILKQFEKIGFRILSVDRLKFYLGIEKTEYLRFGDFKTRVLNVCQKALEKNTDITFTYEPFGKRGNGGKILFLKFLIKKNDTYVDQLTLSSFIQQNQSKDIIDIIDTDTVYDDNNELSAYERRMLFLSDACDNEFSTSELKVLNDKMIELLPHDIVKNELECFNYLMRKYRYMNMQNEKKKIKYRFRYMVSVIGKD